MDVYRRIVFIGILPLIGDGAFRASIGSFISILAAVFCRESAPFLRESTNDLLVVGQYQILATCLGALAILSGALEDFELGDLALGSILLGFNFLVVVLCGWWCVSRFIREKDQLQWRQPLSSDELKLVEDVMKEGASKSGENSPTGEGLELGRVGGGGGGGGENVLALEQLLLRPADVVLERKIGSGAFGEV